MILEVEMHINKQAIIMLQKEVIIQHFCYHT